MSKRELKALIAPQDKIVAAAMRSMAAEENRILESKTKASAKAKSKGKARKTKTRTVTPRKPATVSVAIPLVTTAREEPKHERKRLN